MIGFGSANGHNIELSFGDILSGISAYTVMFWIIVNDTPAVADHIVGKWNESASLQEWIITIDSNLKIGAAHHDGTSVTSATVSNTALTLGAVHHVGLIWDDITIEYYLDGVADGTPAFTRNIRNGTGPFYIGARPPDYTLGCAMDIGEVIVDTAAGDIGTILNHRAGSHLGIPASEFYFRGLHVDDPEFFGAVTTKANGETNNVEHALSTCAFLPQGNFLKPAVMGGIFRVIDEDEETPETNSQHDILTKVLDEDLELNDGGGENVWDPDGFLEETMSDGTVWKTKYPPFIKRTRWT